MEALPELHPQTTKELISIRDTFARIKKLPPDYDFQLPTLISHADDYSDDLPRLRRYAGQVISARIMQLGYMALYKTYYFLDMFLRGYSDRNIYEMVFASRALIEVYAVTADTYRTIVKNAGDHPDGFLGRVKEIDRALIKATYGTRLELVKKVFKDVASSDIRAAEDQDVELIEAKNILTRIDRVSRLEDYPECRSDYDRLSEYVHPNTGQNLIIAWPSSKHADWVRISRRSKYAFVTAVNVSVGPTDKASRLIVHHVLDGNFPFAGEVYFPKQAKE
jgi:hypothetical protein